jgi:hypothetical protein
LERDSGYLERTRSQTTRVSKHREGILSMWRIIIPVIIAIIGVLGNIILNTTWGVTQIQNSFTLNILKIVTYCAAVVPTLYSLIRAEARYQDSEKDRNRRLALDDLRDYLRAAIIKLFPGEDSNTIRANIMVPDGSQLVILCSVNMEFCKDFDIRLDFGQGCSGVVWNRANGKTMSERWIPVLASKANLTSKRLKEMWHLTDEQINTTKGIQWILSTPIFHQDGPKTRCLGVLSFDGFGKPLKNMKRLQKASLHKDSADVAEDFGRIMTKFDILN